MNRPASDTIASRALAEVGPAARPHAPAYARPRAGAKVRLYYLVEGLSSHAVALMLASIYFYTTRHFGWGSTQNFLLAAVLGVIYVAGALSAHAVATRLGRRRTLVLTYLVMSAAAGAALASSSSAAALVMILLIYSGVSAITWPALESLVSAGAAPGELARRLGVYNCVWSGAGAVTVAGAGVILKFWPAGIFVLPLIVHAAMALVMANTGRGRASNTKRLLLDATQAGEAEPAKLQGAEPELLRARTLALWMSRLALPATFVVISSLLAAMPTLPLIRRLDPAAGTVLASVWMAARWGTFLVLGMTMWWHTRPRALLWAAGLLLVAFVAITFQPAWLSGSPEVATAPWVVWVVIWQVALGLALGLIYSASLYFGMVLSEGSTEHGGYHEALIGLGTIIGPGAGALAERLGGGSPAWGVAAVGAILGASVIACGYVAARRGTE